MHIFADAARMRAFSRQRRAEGKRIGLVPTMGCLHAGHLSLIEEARQRADIVVVSIYVNPTQFSINEDFGRYPRQQEEDHAKLRQLAVEACFQPRSLYAGAGGSDADNVVGAGTSQAGGHETYVEVEQLQKGLCGQSRPHFFRGVATVVSKLFNIVDPDVAIFGQKDYQQWRIIARMARDLDFAVEVVGLRIVREEDGLAMSSRNALLTPEDRVKARAIPMSLQAVKERAHNDASLLASTIRSEVCRRITESTGRVDYVEVVDAENLQPVDEVRQQPILVAVAAFYGSVRLIDNVIL